MGVRVGYIIAMVRVVLYLKKLPPVTLEWLAINDIVEQLEGLDAVFTEYPVLKTMQSDELTAFGLHQATPEILDAIARRRFEKAIKR